MKNILKTSHNTTPFSIAIFIALAVSLFVSGYFDLSNQTTPFDGERALEFVEYQLSLGPRIPGSLGHANFGEWIIEELVQQGWNTTIQESVSMGHPIKNFVARHGDPIDGIPKQPWIILGAHYDTRIYADQDPELELRSQPVPGANDGASGVAVLMELARVIPKDYPGEIWLVFFDAEDNGRISGWDWILGSHAFVETLAGVPDAVVIVDMIGDTNLNIMMEQSSNQILNNEIWTQAAELGYSDQFIPVIGYNILDDHIPFLKEGIPAVDIIDFDYPYWHTTEDTLDKVSAESMQIVGDTLMAWLESKR